VDEFEVFCEEVEDRATLIIHNEIETVKKVIRALNLLEQDGRIGGGKAGIDSLAEIWVIEKKNKITG
jgi:nitrogen regulatory protein PII